MKVGYFSSITQWFPFNSEFIKKRLLLLYHKFLILLFLWWLAAFIQTDLSQAALYFLAQSFDDFVISCLHVSEYLLDLQWASNTAIFLTTPTHCSQVLIFIPNTLLSLCAQVIDLCFAMVISYWSALSGFRCTLCFFCLTLLREIPYSVFTISWLNESHENEDVLQ